MDAEAGVVVLVATYRRNRELSRLLKALEASEVRVTGMVVADNGADPACREVVDSAAWPQVYLALPENQGCGAGLHAAELAALEQFPHAAYWWILDDDVVPPPTALGRLREALDQTGGGMSVPLLIDERGKVWAFPEPAEPRLRRVFRQTDVPEEVEARLGRGPHAACWATGACQLVRTKAAQDVGLHREDFWMLGEDLEYSMRMANGPGLCFVTDVLVPHLPPPGVAETSNSEAWAARKFRALLQNLTYLAFHCPSQSRHLWRYVPGNYRRYFHTHGWAWPRWVEAAGCFWNGAVRGRPAGRHG
ncbi:MAG: glycosyltransferase [Verrucomicrobiia bacterium]